MVRRTAPQTETARTRGQQNSRRETAHTPVWVLIFVLLVSSGGHVKTSRGREMDHQTLKKRIVRHVSVLADSIGERNIWRPESLNDAAAYIENEFQRSGYAVNIQSFSADSVEVRNLEAELPGRDGGGGIVVLGAHYDSVIGCPGANDNATGVAALIEIARALAGESPFHAIRFVAFVNEEPPFFQTGEMGSRMYARRCKKRNENIVGMLSLETIGYYSNEEGSQHYPFPFSLFYPNTANFVGFVGNLSSRSLVGRVKSAFASKTDFPCESAAVPGWLTGIGWSDHWSFWQEGYPALMVTDTALFRYDHYHTAGDTPDKIEYEQLTRVVAGLVGVAADLAGIEGEPRETGTSELELDE